MSTYIMMVFSRKNRRIAVVAAVALLLITAVSVIAAGPSDTTVADFAAGSGCYVGQTLTGTDGEVVLTPTFGDLFDGVFPATWGIEPFQAGGTATVGGGVLTADNAVAYSPLYALPRSVEFVATFSMTGSQHAGFLTVVPGSIDVPFAFFSTGNLSLDQGLYARTNDGAGFQDTLIAGINWLGVPHRYGIIWTGTEVIYSIDGTAVVTHTTDIPAADMRVGFSDNSSDVLTVDWVRIRDFPVACTFTSREFDSGITDAQWLTLNSTGFQQPGVVTYSFETCASNTSGSCTTWNPVTGSAIFTPTFGRYLQYRAALTSTYVFLTPVIYSVDIAGQTPTAVTMGRLSAQTDHSAWTTPLLMVLLLLGVSVLFTVGWRHARRDFVDRE